MDEIQKELATRYPPFRFGTWEHCVYCGVQPNSVDHAIPLAYASPSLLRQMRRSFAPQVPACLQCNHSLGSRVFSTFDERCVFVSLWLQRKANHIGAEWQMPEIQQLHGSLKRYVLMKQAQRSDLVRRWLWYGTDSFYRNLENLLYEPMLSRENASFHEQYHAFFRGIIDAVQSRLNSWQNESRCEETPERYGTPETSGANATTECQTA